MQSPAQLLTDRATIGRLTWLLSLSFPVSKVGLMLPTHLAVWSIKESREKKMAMTW